MFKIVTIGLITFFISNTVQAGDNKAESTAQTICSACHGVDGNSLLPVNPIIAGQHEDYIYRQLKMFKSGARKNTRMLGIANTLSDDDMVQLSKYFAGFKSKTVGTSDRELATEGEKIYRSGILEKGVAACSACHLPTGSGIPGKYPRIAGQHPEYTVNQLTHFKEGRRRGSSAGIMRSIAGKLSKKQMLALAEYLAGLN